MVEKCNKEVDTKLLIHNDHELKKVTFEVETFGEQNKHFLSILQLSRNLFQSIWQNKLLTKIIKMNLHFLLSFMKKKIHRGGK